MLECLDFVLFGEGANGDLWEESINNSIHTRGGVSSSLPKRGLLELRKSDAKRLQLLKKYINLKETVFMKLKYELTILNNSNCRSKICTVNTEVEILSNAFM